MNVATETISADDLRDRMTQAAMLLALDIDIQDRIATDPDHPCDRSARADAARARMRAEDLTRYRDARDAWEAAQS